MRSGGGPAHRCPAPRALVNFETRGFIKIVIEAGTGRLIGVQAEQLPKFCALLVKEAFKTWGDAVSEVREAVDFFALLRQ